MEWKNGTTVVASWDYGYDGAGRLNSLSNSFGDSATYVYDGEGKITRVQNSNGMEIGYTYNQARGWPSEISCQRCIPMDAMTEQQMAEQQGGFEETDSPGGPPWAEAICSTPFSKWTLTYDGGANTIGKLTRSLETVTTYTDYGYDSLYRLTSETRTGTSSYSETHGYDLAGNVTTLNGSTFATYDNANKFSTISGGSVTQDGDGNITDISANGMTYSGGSFDPRNKLNQVTVSSTAYNYKTDGNDRRVFKQVGSSGTKTFYIFSGDQLIGEITGSTPSVAYSWGADGVASERLLTGTPKSLFYCYGPQGETRNLTDSSVTVVDTYLYNAYGKLRSSTGSDPNPFRYGGKFGYYTDPNTGLQLAGARWYSPNAFRWLGRDPIHYRGGDNLYSYVMGNPVMYVDPSGLATIYIGGGGDGVSKIVKSYFDFLHETSQTGRYDKYFSHGDQNTIVNYIKSLPVTEPVVIIGHSWGGDTAAKIAAGGECARTIDMLVTVDPVSIFRPKFDKVRNGTSLWIDVNAIGGRWYQWSNLVAGAGQSWNSSPRDHAHVYVEAPFPHDDFVNLLHAASGHN